MLHQSELHGGIRCKGKATCRSAVLAASTVHPRVPAAQTSTHLESASTRTFLRLPPPHIVEQPQACSISLMQARYFSKRQALSISVPEAENVHTFRPPPPQPLGCTILASVEQPQQACPISWRTFMAAAPLQRQATCRLLDRRSGKHSPLACQRQRRARTLRPPPPRTVEQPQACSISRRTFMMAAPLQRQTPAGSLIVEAASTLRQSARGRDEHAPCVRLHLAPWSSRKLARSVGGAS